MPCDFRLTLGALLLSAAVGHASAVPFHADVARTSYGVVHVRGDNFGGLGYGFAQRPGQPMHVRRQRTERSRAVTVERLRGDGALDRVTKTFYFSRQGAILVKPEADLSWGANSAYALGDPNRYNTRLIEQWLGIATAATVGALKQSIERVVGLPWVNTLAADRNGDTLYVDASMVPNVSDEQARGPCLLSPRLFMLDGSNSACAWKNDPGAPAGIVSPRRSPSLMFEPH